LRKNRER